MLKGGLAFSKVRDYFHIFKGKDFPASARVSGRGRTFTSAWKFHPSALTTERNHEKRTNGSLTSDKQPHWQQRESSR